MFRITCADEPRTRALRLEGWLTGEQLPLLEEAISGADGRAIALDLSAVRWVDAAAAARLNALRAAGVSLTAHSPFVERLLATQQRRKRA
jgi:anti-anti-sigma regulatory factor